MAHRRRYASVVVVLAVLWTTACENDAEHFATLNALVREGANQQEVVKRLGSGEKVYQRGTYNWDGLTVETPYIFGASNWIVWLEFAERRLARVSVGTDDSRNIHPRGAPRDKGSEELLRRKSGVG